MKRLNISKDLNPKYFWDIEPGKLDAEGSKQLIIYRVFTMGTAKEIMLILILLPIIILPLMEQPLIMVFIFWVLLL